LGSNFSGHVFLLEIYTLITEPAIVVRCDGRQVLLELQRGSVCAGCELNQGCGTGALGRLLGHRSKPLVIETEHELKPGDRLVLGLPESALVKASLIVYGLPLLGMVGAGLLATLSAAPEALVALIASAGFILGFKFSTFIGNRLEHDLLTPYIVDIQLNSGPPAES
jgi:sigma-E factor negative regulatory protein RseC